MYNAIRFAFQINAFSLELSICHSLKLDKKVPLFQTVFVIDYNNVSLNEHNRILSGR